MGNLSKALGGYTETPWGWVDDSDHSNEKQYTPPPQDLDLTDPERVWVGDVTSVNTRDILSEWGLRFDGYNIMRGTHDNKWYIEYSIMRYALIPVKYKEIRRNGKNVDVTRDGYKLIERTLNEPLDSGLFKGVSMKRVGEFLDSLPISTRSKIELGDDLKSDKWSLRYEKLKAWKPTSSSYVDDITEFMVYAMIDRHGAEYVVELGGVELKNMARKIRDSL